MSDVHILIFCLVFDSSWLDSFISTGLNLLLTIFTFASSLMVSLGFRDWCTLVTDPKGGFDRCVAMVHV